MTSDLRDKTKVRETTPVSLCYNDYLLLIVASMHNLLNKYFTNLMDILKSRGLFYCFNKTNNKE